jgi:hypothetical protein
MVFVLKSPSSNFIGFVALFDFSPFIRKKIEIFNYGFDYISTTFQLHFEVKNVISNYKIFFSTQNDIFNCLPK